MDRPTFVGMHLFHSAQLALEHRPPELLALEQVAVVVQVPLRTDTDWAMLTLAQGIANMALGARKRHRSAVPRIDLWNE